jgi:M6 family metalloprotease-like protein
MLKIKSNLFRYGILSIFLLITLVSGHQIIIDKNQRQPIPNQGQTIQKLVRKATKYKGNVIRDNNRIQLNAKNNQVDTIKVLALRVEFTEDSTYLTTGNGKMDLDGFLSPDSGLFYDPPHNRIYFERQMQGMRNFYLLNSLGKLCIDYTVMPNSDLSSYQLSHPMDYYGDTTSIEGIETGLCRLMNDAIRIADRDSELQFSDYNYIIIFHAGAGLQSDIRGDSPFDLLAGTIPSSALDAYLGTPYIPADEGQTRIYSSTILPEMMRQDTLYEGQTNILGMTGLAGTLCHEFVHVLGGYDLYDVTGNSMGVGAWSLMGFGGWLGDWSAGAPPGVIPGMLDAYHKVAFGWVEPLVVNIPKESIPIFAATMDSSRFPIRGDSLSPLIVKIPISQTEYFLIENRQTDVRKKDTIVVDTEDGVLIWVEDGEYDFFLPGSGLLIWHIDEQVITEYGQYNAINIFPEHKGVDLEEGDGIQDFDQWSGISQYDYQVYGSQYDPFFIGGFNSQFTDSTTPNSDGYFGKTHIRLSTLTAPDTTMLLTSRFGFYQNGFPKYLGRATKLLSATCSDLDEDGFKEIIASDSGGAVFAWRHDGTSYTGLANGIFIPRILSSMVAPLAIGDVMGDDKSEVICVGEDGKVCIYQYSGQGILAQWQINSRILSAPVLVDLDNDGKKEIVIGAADMNLYIWKGDGSLYPGFPLFLGSELRSAVALTDTINPQIVVLGSDNRLFLVNSDATIASGFPLTLSSSPLYTLVPPVVGDIDRNGMKEIIAIINTGSNFKLFIIGLNGNTKYSSFEIIQSPVYSAPTLVDIDRDGFLEIVIGAADMNLYIWKGDGSLYPGFPLFLGSELRSAVALTDTINPQIVVLGSDNRLFLVNSDATIASGFPLTLSSSPLYTLVPPVVGDIDRNGMKEIIAIINTGSNFKLFIIGLNGNTKYSSFEIIQSPVYSAPTLVDIDRDGFLEIVIAGGNRIYAFNFNGTLQTNYPFAQDSIYTTTQVLDGWLITTDVPFVFNSSPIMCDINNDGLLDITIGSPRYGVLGLDGRNGKLLNYFPLATVGSVSATPLILDLDDDNDMEIAVGSDAGIFYVWDFPTLTQELSWNQYLKDACHTGLISILPIIPESSNIVVKNFYAYPNPAGKEITVRYWLGKNPGNVKINVLDITGKSKYEISNSNCYALTDNEEKISLDNIPSGIYLLRLEVNSNQKKEVKFYKFAIVK